MKKARKKKHLQVSQPLQRTFQRLGLVVVGRGRCTCSDRTSQLKNVDSHNFRPMPVGFLYFYCSDPLCIIQTLSVLCINEYFSNKWLVVIYINGKFFLFYFILNLEQLYVLLIYHNSKLESRLNTCTREVDACVINLVTQSIKLKLQIHILLVRQMVKTSMNDLIMILNYNKSDSESHHLYI